MATAASAPMPCLHSFHRALHKASPVRQAVLCLLAGLLVHAASAVAEEAHAPTVPHAAAEQPATPEPATMPADDGTPRLGVIQGIALPFKPLKPSAKPPAASMKEESAKVEGSKSPPSPHEAPIVANAAPSPHEAVPAASTTPLKIEEAPHAPAAPTTVPVASTFRPIFAAGRHRSSMQPGVAAASGARASTLPTATPAAASATVQAVVKTPGATAPVVAVSGDQPLDRLRQRLAQTFGSRDVGGATVRVSSKGGAGAASAGDADASGPASASPSKKHSLDHRAAAEATSRLALSEPTGGGRLQAASAPHPTSASDGSATMKPPTSTTDLSARFNPQTGACGSGQRQSPIELQNTFKVDLEPVTFHYQPTPFAVIDNGRTVQVQVAAGNSIEVNGRKFELTRVEFRHPAEERIDGKSYALGVHLVHRDSEGRQAVVAVVMDEGWSGPVANPVVQTVWNNLPLERGQAEPARAPLDLERLLPPNRGYFTYMGSMTAPPCEEGVLWMVMKTPMPIATPQVELFARLYPMNARSLQAANGRMVKESN
ncbi:MAG: carbonate dehydratase [Rhizobacter sp.]|nr:carbonate dehydratase [Rhizobacter sp.]